MSELYRAANALLNSIHCDDEIDREKALRCGDYAVGAATRIGRLEEALLKLSRSDFREMTFQPDYLCPNGCAAQDALTEQLEARKVDADEIERLRAALDEAIRCQLVSVDFDPTNPEGHNYGVEATLRSGDSSKQWRAGNYLLIPVDDAYELLSSVCEAEND